MEHEHNRDKIRRDLGLGKAAPNTPRSTPAFAKGVSLSSGPKPEPASDFVASKRKLTHLGVGEGDAGLPESHPLASKTLKNVKDALGPPAPFASLEPLPSHDPAAKFQAEVSKALAPIDALANAEPADDAPDAPIDPKPGGGWDECSPADAEEEFRQLDSFLSAFLKTSEDGLGELTGEEIDDLAFVEFFNRIAAASHLDMIENGFWDDPGAMKARAAIRKIGAANAAGLFENVREGDGKDALRALVDVAIDRTHQAPRNDLSDLMLMVTELAEAAEGERKNPGCPDDKIPEFTMLEAELADVILRIMDFAGGRELRVAEALVAKRHFNRTRPYKHGKTC